MKKSVLSTLAVAACVLSQGAFAHTGLQYNTITEGTAATYNAVAITHGCTTNAGPEGTNGTQLNVLASSAVFPNGTGAVVNKLNADGTDGAAIDLSTVISGTVAGVFTNMTPVPAFPGVFPFMSVTLDALSNARGMHAWGNANNTPAMPGVKSVGLAPFKMAGVSFLADAPGAINCATALKVRIAAANWCLKGKANDKNPARADIWIGHMTSKFNDVNTMPYNATDAAAGKFYWPTLTINRDLVKHPLDASCGAGYAVAIAPSDADIDAYLPITTKEVPAGYWPNI